MIATLEPKRHGAAFDPDEFASPDPKPAALLEVRERAREAAGRLAALKPQERRTIGLQAAGCSYAETQAITGWTYTGGTEQAQAAAGRCLRRCDGRVVDQIRATAIDPASRIAFSLRPGSSASGV